MVPVVRLWYHENQRVFADRLINDEDRNWFRDQLKLQMSDRFSLDPAEVLVQDPILYGDFMIPNVDNKIYAEIEDHEKVCWVFLNIWWKSPFLCKSLQLVALWHYAIYGNMN